MLKKTITYQDLDGNEVVEDFYFHLSKAELTEWALVEEDLVAKLKDIAAGNDKKEVIKTFKWILEKAVGQRSEDGKRFIKDPEFAADFMQSEAFGELLVELFSNADAAAQFIVGVVPQNLSEKLLELADKELKGMTTVNLPAPEIENRRVPKKITEYTEDELRKMPQDQFEKLVAGTPTAELPREVLVIAMQRKTQQ